MRLVDGLRRHQLWSNFWAMPCSMIFGTVLATGLFLALDARGVSLWMAKAGWPFSISASTAQGLASGLVTLHAAFSTLYFSITLLVLTLAAGNLGVRLIDRWIGDVTIRFTLGLLLSLLAASVILLLSVESNGPPGQVPRLTTLVLVTATILALGWMTNALHHLGRTVHVDTSIAKLGRDAAGSLRGNRYLEPPGVDMETGVPILAHETGYVDEINYREILREARKRREFISLAYSSGNFMMAGEPIGMLVGGDSGDWVTRHIPCAQYRNDTRGPEFESNLLVEIAARALSPGINDLYSALACCDRLASILAAAVNVHRLPQWLADADGVPRLELPRERVTEFMDGPLKSLRQAAAAYPTVSIHMIELIGRLPSPGGMDDTLRGFLLSHAEALAEHASARAEIDRDRADVALALADARRHLFNGLA